MTLLPNLQARFRQALAAFTDRPEPWLEMIRRAQDARFGDYQANFAMALGKQLNKKPQELAAEVVARLDVADLCQPPEVAGPGFINLRLKDEWLVRAAYGRGQRSAAGRRAGRAAADLRDRLLRSQRGQADARGPYPLDRDRRRLVPHAPFPRPPGDQRQPPRRLGHAVRHDHLRLQAFSRAGCLSQSARAGTGPALSPGAAVGRLLRGEGKSARAPAAAGREAAGPGRPAPGRHARCPGQKADKKLREAVSKLENSVKEAAEEIEAAQKKIAAVDADPILAQLAAEHPQIGRGTQAETAKLHAGDAENRRLWQEFMPYCLEDIQRIYRRLDVHFDHTLGESYYHDMLPGVVEELRRRGIARESQGAVCVFLEGQPAPMIVQKQDGAYLYATTDLATIRYRMEQWRPDAILYVVDHRQSLHFQQLFATARLLGYDKVELQHVSFGTVLGKDGRPFKTRAGDTVGLEGLLDEAILRAARIVAENDDAKPDGAELSPDQRACVAETVGIGALKYADLSQNRTSDYEFDYEKMLAMNGNTATYMQYAYARVRNIFAKGDIDVEQLRASGAAITLGTPAERALGLELLRFGDALSLAMTDYRPNQLTAYLFDLANSFSTFYEKCPVLKAETPELRDSRLLLSDLTARTIRKGLELLGIGVEEKM